MTDREIFEHLCNLDSILAEYSDGIVPSEALIRDVQMNHSLYREALLLAIDHYRPADDPHSIRKNRKKMDPMWYLEMMLKFWPEGGFEPNFVDLIAACRGWNPLVPGETMEIHTDGKAYRVVRLKREQDA
jgi:hypothetical protein